MMKSLKWILGLCAVVIMGHVAEARIGETLEQCKKRYGKVVEERNNKIMEESAYTFKIAFSTEYPFLDITIIAIIKNGTVKKIIYFRKGPFNTETILYLLNVNSLGKQWIRQGVGHEWILADGALLAKQYEQENDNRLYIEYSTTSQLIEKGL